MVKHLFGALSVVLVALLLAAQAAEDEFRSAETFGFEEVESNGPSADNGRGPHLFGALKDVGKKAAFTVGRSLWNMGSCAIHKLPNKVTVKSYSISLYQKIRQGEIPTCIKERLPTWEQVKQLATESRKFYFRTPVPRLVNYVWDSTPAALKTYIIDIQELTTRLVSDLAATNPPLKEVQQFAVDILNAVSVFALDMHEAAPYNETAVLGLQVYKSALKLTKDIAMNVPAKDISKRTMKLSQRLATFSVHAAKPAFFATSGYSKTVFLKLWNQHVKRNSDEQQKVVETDEPDLSVYVQEIKEAADKFLKTSGENPSDEALHKFALEVKAATGVFGQEVAGAYTPEMLGAFSRKVLTASKKFATSAVGSVPKMALIWWATKVAAAGSKFAAGVVWKTPAKAQAFLAPMHAVSLMKEAIERNVVPSNKTIKDLQIEDGIQGAWRMTQNLYVKLHLDNKTAIFEKIPTAQWASFLKCKAEEIQKGSIELYTQYGPGTGKPSEFAQLVKDLAITGAVKVHEYVLDFYDCAKRNGYLDNGKQAWDTTYSAVKNAAFKVSDIIREAYHDGENLDDLDDLDFHSSEAHN